MRGGILFFQQELGRDLSRLFAVSGARLASPQPMALRNDNARTKAINIVRRAPGQTRRCLGPQVRT